MKLHYTKILLFFFPLYILVTSYHVHSKNKPYMTQRLTQTNRSLCECDTQSTNYNNDEDIKSVKGTFDRQTSQRLREYDERLQDKRQKRKEERDKNIQKIILKDKMEKTLAEKVEKGCLKCACGLGGVAASVGIIGPIAVNEWTKAATVAAIAAAQEAAAAKGAVAGAEAGIKTVISGLQKLGVSTLGHKELGSFINPENYTNAIFISKSVQVKYNGSNCLALFSRTRSGLVDLEPFCTWVMEKSAAAMNIREMLQGNSVSYTKVTEKAVETIVSDAKKAAGKATEKAIEEAIKSSTAGVQAKYASCQTAIIASVVAILIIVLVMIIIYLVLRYRRKKKMNKKAHYTKLLNQ
ncbi:hypothetical protein PFFVO_06047 [Plasmodium falciparum Vietnam Oak-Knoll (FVO)]|uniref:Surface antigen n=1 Tax=Plasmodium falciparum Vietnam Oak-Knoll (FVO) TaxID=1036723 RepID=A0A024UXS6_PLAFA|nr:hypothetical protein PFFVO_06047 [Plasmodium falciparum Vietnam Oak-Knoll (FVO)]